MAVYTVVQGDHLSSIAHTAGLHSYKTLWNDGENSHLKELRRNPNVLFPGDQIEVREALPKAEPAATEKHHRFRRQGTTLRLRLRLLSEPGHPAKGAACRLEIGSRDRTLAADGDGVVETPIAPDARSGRLFVNGNLNITAALAIGELDPIDTVSGQIGRLNNLGYFAGRPTAEPADALAKLRLRSAVEEFQCDHALKVDGVLGPATRKELEKAHGC